MPKFPAIKSSARELSGRSVLELPVRLSRKEVSMRYVRIAVLALLVVLGGAAAVQATGPLYDPFGLTAN